MERATKPRMDEKVDTWLKRAARRPGWRTAMAVTFGAVMLIIETAIGATMHGSVLVSALSALPMCLAFTGFQLLGVAYARFGDETCCAKCGYDLTGIAVEEGVDRCPECGSHWREHRGTVKGRRIFRPVFAVAAIGLIGVWFLDMGYKITHPLHGQRAAMWLVPTESLIVEAAYRGFARETWTEIGRRTLSADQRNRLASALLDRRSANQYLDPDASGWLQAAVAKGQLEAPQVERFYADMVSLRLESPLRVRLSDRVIVTLLATDCSNFGPGSPVLPMLYFGGFRSGPITTPPTAEALHPGLLNAESMARWPTTKAPEFSLDPAQTGPITIKASGWIVVGPYKPLSGTVAWNPDGTPVIPSAAVWSRRVDLERTIQVDP